MKVKAVAEIVLQFDITEKAELHWYEYPTIGKIEFKFKKVIR